MPASRTTKGRPDWIPSSVQAIIWNPVYKGWACLLSKGKQDGDIINGTAHQLIVDPLLWQAAQPKKGKPRRPLRLLWSEADAEHE